jgi:hypothetical protein
VKVNVVDPVAAGNLDVYLAPGADAAAECVVAGHGCGICGLAGEESNVKPEVFILNECGNSPPRCRQQGQVPYLSPDRVTQVRQQGFATGTVGATV